MNIHTHSKEDTCEACLSEATKAERERCVKKCQVLQQKYRNKERRYIVQRCIDYIEETDDE